jgi:enediyne biosynthesis protein E4
VVDIGAQASQPQSKNGTFCDASDQAGPALRERRVSRGLAVGDLFNDGNMDIVVGDIDGAPMLLRNRGMPGRHGSASNWQARRVTGSL